MSEYAQLGQLTCSQNDFKFNGNKKEVKENYDGVNEYCAKYANIDFNNPDPPLVDKYKHCITESKRCEEEDPTNEYCLDDKLNG